jgi:hypothetical protein
LKAEETYSNQLTPKANYSKGSRPSSLDNRPSTFFRGDFKRSALFRGYPRPTAPICGYPQMKQNPAIATLQLFDLRRFS